MDIQTIWLIILSIATPVAGVVSFGIQVRNIKKLKLENQKLELEVIEIQKEMENSEAQIVKASNDEVLKYSNKVMFSRKSSSPTMERSTSKEPSIMSRFSAGEILLILFLIFILIYFVYDVYRFVVWLWDMF